MLVPYLIGQLAQAVALILVPRLLAITLAGLLAFKDMLDCMNINVDVVHTEL